MLLPDNKMLILQTECIVTLSHVAGMRAVQREDFRDAGESRKSQVFGECCWLILGLSVKVANRIPRWDATEDILWECPTACPALKVGLSVFKCLVVSSGQFPDGLRFSGSLSGITGKMIRVREIHCCTGDPKYVCWCLSNHELQKVLQIM